MNHADHEWAKEQIAAHLAGGLSADERARLEAHAASCAECIAELDAARRFDRQMDDLFAPIRPKAGLEDRIIRVLRCAPSQKPRSLASRVILAAAAVILMGILGFVIIQVDQGSLTWMPQAGAPASLADALNPSFAIQAEERSVSVARDGNRFGGRELHPGTSLRRCPDVPLVRDRR
ncbi:MAG: zf-HC2 domain-containing protein [Planctomycetes bacterium]|nr:zf-HC2 domain-containing protein [Planctomycetota bacterium]